LKKPRARNDEAKMAQEDDSDDDQVILMVTTAYDGKPN
jgi:hypothetical protein